MHGKEVTIYELARELKVSPSTVSRALQDHHSIGKATKEKVKNLAQIRGYQQNFLAASLRNKKTNTIGVIVPLINRPFIASLISGIEAEANKEGFRVIISQSRDSYDQEVENAQAIYASRVSGLITSLAIDTPNFDHFQPFRKHNIPVVFVDRVPENLDSDKVVIDNFTAGYKATKHLIAQGCKRIGHIGGSQQRNVYAERQKGYLQALKEHHLPIDNSLIHNLNDLNADGGFQVAKKLYDGSTRVDGIFAANDTTAVSAIQYAKSVQWKVPEELAIIGFNDDPVASIIEPALSTVRHPAGEMGRMAARQVLQNQDGNVAIQSQNLVLKTSLILRQSSSRVPVANQP